MANDGPERFNRLFRPAFILNVIPERTRAPIEPQDTNQNQTDASKQQRQRAIDLPDRPAHGTKRGEQAAHHGQGSKPERGIKPQSHHL